MGRIFALVHAMRPNNIATTVLVGRDRIAAATLQITNPHPYGTSIGSAVFVERIGVSITDRPTDRSRYIMSPVLLRLAMRPNNHRFLIIYSESSLSNNIIEHYCVCLFVMRRF